MLALMDTTSPAHGPAPSPPPPTRAVDPNTPEHNERHPARPHTPAPTPPCAGCPPPAWPPSPSPS
ncbi:hypothetical protein ACFQX6_62990 [Streptosporangium lutulentum]